MHTCKKKSITINFPLHRSFQKIRSNPRPCVKFRNTLVSYGRELPACVQIPLSAVCKCFAVTFHIRRLLSEPEDAPCRGAIILQLSSLDIYPSVYPANDVFRPYKYYWNSHFLAAAGLVTCATVSTKHLHADGAYLCVTRSRTSQCSNVYSL